MRESEFLRLLVNDSAGCKLCSAHCARRVSTRSNDEKESESETSRFEMQMCRFTCYPLGNIRIARESSTHLLYFANYGRYVRCRRWKIPKIRIFAKGNHGYVIIRLMIFMCLWKIWMFLFQFRTKILSLHRQKVSENQEKLIMFFPYSLHIRHPKLTRQSATSTIVELPINTSF